MPASGRNRAYSPLLEPPPYRRWFSLIGIAGIPQLLVLPLRLGQSWFTLAGTAGLWSVVSTTVVFWIAATLAYLFSEGATILAVSEIYLGRQASITGSLSKVWGNLGYLFGVVVLGFLAALVGFVFLIVPGIYIACRLSVSVPSAMIEEKGPFDSLSRSFDLTRGFAGRAFMITVLWLVIFVAATLLFGFPFSTLMIFSKNDPGGQQLWAALTQVGSTLASVLSSPILLIALSVFYYDLRVRKEAFDLQFMMNPDSTSAPGTTGVTSLFS